MPAPIRITEADALSSLVSREDRVSTLQRELDEEKARWALERTHRGRLEREITRLHDELEQLRATTHADCDLDLEFAAERYRQLEEEMKAARRDASHERWRRQEAERDRDACVEIVEYVHGFGGLTCDGCEERWRVPGEVWCDKCDPRFVDVD